MRLIGSFHTMTTHTRLGRTTSSPTGRSTSTGAVDARTAMGSFSQASLGLFQGFRGPGGFAFRPRDLGCCVPGGGGQVPCPASSVLRGELSPFRVLRGLDRRLTGPCGVLPGPIGEALAVP